MRLARIRAFPIGLEERIQAVLGEPQESAPWAVEVLIHDLKPESLCLSQDAGKYQIIVSFYSQLCLHIREWLVAGG